MFHLFASNRFEVLLEGLHRRLESELRPSPFAMQRVIVPSLGVQRAITLDAARRYGICSHLEFAFLAQWLWESVARVVPGIAPQSPFDADVLTWRLEQRFADPALRTAHARLGPYLDSADDATRFELARRVATLFEQYTTLRPDWLRAWSRDQAVTLPAGSRADATAWQQDEAWQRALWRAITASMRAAADDPLQRFVDSVTTNPTRARNVLPPSIHLFALPGIVPQHLDVLRAMAQVGDVYVYALNPCREYWFDIVSPRRRERLQRQGAALHADIGHPILATWGRQTQALWSALDAQLDDADVDASTYVEPVGARRLARLQRAILDLSAPAPTRAHAAPLVEDDSIELHVCHSLRRELEVLHNRLLVLFSQPGAPGPHEVLVVTPSLDDAAPLIDAVFNPSDPSRHIAHVITGRRAGVEAQALDALLSTVDLGTSRHTVHSLQTWLERPLVMQRMGWSPEDVATVCDWLERAGVRWGLHGEHRTQFGMPNENAHTLDDGLDRLMLGHLMPSQVPIAMPDGSLQQGDEAIFMQTLPAGAATGSRATLLGGLDTLAARLDAWRLQLAEPRDATAWHRLLLDAVNGFFAPQGRAEANALNAVRAGIVQWHRHTVEAGHQRALPASVVRAALAATIASSPPGGAPGGGVTFASMAALRALPYRFIAVVGMNDGAFPTQGLNLEFDLMAQAPRAGDRQPRQVDRNTMLDLLLSARDSLWLSYTGRDIRTNAPLPPGVLVSELVDALAQADGVDAATMHACIATHHPLQPFEASLFGALAPPQRRSLHQAYAQALVSVADDATRAALRLAADAANPRDLDNRDSDDRDNDDPDGESSDADDPDVVNGPTWAAPLFVAALPPPDAPQRQLTLADLKRFFAHPARTLLRQRLGIVLPHADEVPDDHEPFMLDRRHRTAIAARLLPAALQGASATTLLALARAGTEFGLGQLGESSMTREVDAVRAQAAAFTRLACGKPVPHASRTLTSQVSGVTWQLTMDIRDARSDGLHRWSASRLREKDRVTAWIDHLAWQLLAPGDTWAVTHWVARDLVLTLQPQPQPHAEAMLQTLLGLCASGLSLPLPFMPRASWSAAVGESAARQLTVWQGNRSLALTGDGGDAYVQLAWRGLGPLPRHAAFRSTALAVLSPLIDAMTESAT